LKWKKACKLLLEKEYKGTCFAIAPFETKEVVHKRFLANRDLALDIDFLITRIARASEGAIWSFYSTSNNSFDRKVVDEALFLKTGRPPYKELKEQQPGKSLLLERIATGPLLLLLASMVWTLAGLEEWDLLKK
jgi:hypothetical protein